MESAPKSTKDWNTSAVREEAISRGADQELRQGPRVGESPVEILLKAVEAHEGAERDSLEEYERMCEVTSDPVTKFLMRMLLDDESRHHGFLRQMAISLQNAIRFSHIDGALPVAASIAEPVRTELLAKTRARLREEEGGIAALRGLARETSNLFDGLVSLLLEIMVHDTEKHQRILTFIEKRLL